jgi:hypothetical protein
LLKRRKEIKIQKRKEEILGGELLSRESNAQE